jgi:hypothetical protein
LKKHLDDFGETCEESRHERNGGCVESLQAKALQENQEKKKKRPTGETEAAPLKEQPGSSSSSVEEVLLTQPSHRQRANIFPSSLDATLP